MPVPSITAASTSQARIQAIISSRPLAKASKVRVSTRGSPPAAQMRTEAVICIL